MPATYLKIGDAGVTYGGSGFGSSTGSNAIWSPTYRYEAGGSAATKFAYFTFSGLTAGKTYTLAITWVRDANRNTQTPWRVQDGGAAAEMIASAVTGSPSGTVNQELSPAGPVDGSGVSTLRVPWQYLGSFIPSGTSLTVRIGAGPFQQAGQDYSVADGARCQDIAEDLTCAPLSGNLSSTAVWCPRPPNGTGDSIAASIDFTIDQDMTLGQSSATVPAIQLPWGRSLTIADGKTVRVKGDVVMYQTTPAIVATTRVANYHPIRIGQGITGGTIFEFDGSGPAPWKVVADRTAQANGVPKLKGVNGNPVIVRTVNGPNKGRFSDGGFPSQSGMLEADWVNFFDIGDGSTPAIKALLTVSGNTMRIVNCNFTGCGNNTITVNANNAGTVLSIVDTAITGIVASAGKPNALTAGGTGSGAWEIRRCWFEGFVTYNFQSAYGSMSFEDNVYLRQVTYSNATSSPALDRGHLFFKTMTPNSTGAENVPSGVNFADNYILNDYSEASVGNPHMLLPGGSAFTATGCIFEYIGEPGEDIGDACDNGNTTMAIRNSLILKSDGAVRQASGAVWQFSSSSGNLTLEHNTIYCSNTHLSGLQTGHNITPGLAGQVPSVKSNLFWTDQAGVSAIRCDYPASIAQDFVSPGGILNNNLYGMATFATNTVAGAPNQPLPGISGLRFSTAPPAQLDEAPNFVDPNRGFLSWARDVLGFAGANNLGPTATNIQVRDAAFEAIKADKTLIRTSLIPYVRAGFAPTNPALKGSAHDGLDIGAVSVATPSSYVPIVSNYMVGAGLCGLFS